MHHEIELGPRPKRELGDEVHILGKKIEPFWPFLGGLHQDRYTIHIICLGYKLRWQVELLFTEWKSYTNLHKFDTEKETISEALIWASLSSSAIKRFLAHAAEHLL